VASHEAAGEDDGLVVPFHGTTLRRPH
jgi:hypothetical protein